MPESPTLNPPATLASYDETQAPYRLTVLLPAEGDAFAYT